jgi:hypothetical protein
MADCTRLVTIFALVAGLLSLSCQTNRSIDSYGSDPAGRCYHATLPPRMLPADALARGVPRCDSAEWKEMSKVLWAFLDRGPGPYDAQHGATSTKEEMHRRDICFAQSFDRCEVHLSERTGYLLFHLPLGGEWTGARFQKSASRHWSVLQMDGGDIR